MSQSMKKSQVTRLASLFDSCSGLQTFCSFNAGIVLSGFFWLRKCFTFLYFLCQQWFPTRSTFLSTMADTILVVFFKRVHDLQATQYFRTKPVWFFNVKRKKPLVCMTIINKKKYIWQLPQNKTSIKELQNVGYFGDEVAPRMVS